jgi:UDP:flavonoid glycosyltransferase YjiC (YdhE family)
MQYSHVSNPAGQGKKVMLFCSGSRGDVQPVIALASALKLAGFRVCIGTNVNHVPFVQEFQLETVGVSLDSEKILNEMECRDSMAKGNVMKLFARIGEANKKAFPDNIAKKIDAIQTFSPHIILASVLEYYEIAPIAGILSLPVLRISLQSLYPSKDQISCLGEPSWCPHRMFAYLFHYILFSGERDCKQSIILDQLPDGKPWVSLTFEQHMADFLHPITPSLIGFSPCLFRQKSDWTSDVKEAVKLTGFWVIDKQPSAQTLGGDNFFGGESAKEMLSKFLLGGPAIYMGWGSMIAVSEKHMACLAVRSLMKAQVRGIILGGWAKLDAERLKDEADSALLQAYAKDNVCFVQMAPHEWLFPQCSVIVHHGGAGTTAASMRAGVPVIITPCFGDQFDNAQLVESTGCGVALKQFSRVTPATLADALTQCMSDPDMQENARSLGQQLKNEDGLGNAVRIVEDFIVNELDTGMWKAKHTVRTQQMRNIQARKPPGCLAWITRLCCSGSQTRFLPHLTMSKHVPNKTHDCVSGVLSRGGA